jgi:nucleoside-diphosphate-sugar epimerase
MMLDPANTMIFDHERGNVSVFGTGDEPFNLTTVDDTAHFTAKIAVDPAEVSGVHYVSGAEASWNTIAAEIEQVSGRALTLRRLGDADDLRRVIADAEDPWSVVPQWYLLSMLTVPPFPTNDNRRYPDAHPTGLREHVTNTYAPAAT